MSEDSKVKERKEYKKNENYDQEVLKQIMRTYRIARKYGNEILKKEMLEKLYFFGRSYVYSVMWETYPTLMKNPFGALFLMKLRILIVTRDRLRHSCFPGSDMLLQNIVPIIFIKQPLIIQTA